VIDENGLQIGNDGRSTHYGTREALVGESVIALTLANQPIAKWSILADDHTTGSAHEGIEWDVVVNSQEEADQVRVVEWNLAAMTAKDGAAAEKQWTELAKERAHLDAECTEDEIQQETTWCQEAMSSVVEATAKSIGLCAKSKRCWNVDLRETRKTVGRKKRRKQISAEAAQARAELHWSIRQSNSQMWRDYIEQVTGAEVWRAAPYANLRPGATMQALTDREGKQTKTILEKEEMPRRESFPPHDNDHYCQLPSAATACTCVTEQAVERGLYSQSIKKAPGPHKLSSGTIRPL